MAILNKFSKIQSCPTGFTLIELIVSIFIVLLTLGGISSLFVQALQSVTYLSHQLTANYLAQEGIEVVRNIRDTNWIKGQEWDTGLTGCDSACAGCNCPADDGCAVDYTISSLDGYPNIPLHIYNGYYRQINLGSTTIFKRRVVVNQVTDSDGDPYLEAKVYVCWQERGKSYQTELDENLYNWGP